MDSAYTVSTVDGFAILTINSGYSGFRYIAAPDIGSGCMVDDQKEEKDTRDDNGAGI